MSHDWKCFITRAICQIKRNDEALETIFRQPKPAHSPPHAYAGACVCGPAWIESKMSCETFFAAVCQQPRKKRRSNGAARCLARWNQSRRAERINEEKRSETYRSVASTTPFSSSGDSDRSDCVSLKSGRCRVTSAPTEGFIIVVTENKTDIFMSLICFYWLNQ